MGEYINYRGKQVKIGTGNTLYYTTFHKYKKASDLGQLKADEYGPSPKAYLDPKHGFLFRFPFPDEDHFGLGDIGNHAHDRGLAIEIPRGDYFPKGCFPELRSPKNGITQNSNNIADMIEIELAYQKLVGEEDHQHLRVVYCCPFCRELWSVSGEEASYIMQQIYTRYAGADAPIEDKLYWSAVTERMLIGYLSIHAQPKPVNYPKSLLPLTTINRD